MSASDAKRAAPSLLRLIGCAPLVVGHPSRVLLRDGIPIATRDVSASKYRHLRRLRSNILVECFLSRVGPAPGSCLGMPVEEDLGLRRLRHQAPLRVGDPAL